MASNQSPLKGIGVLVTRPLARAADICALIEKHGGRTVAFPVLDIAPPSDEGALVSALRRLDEVDLMIFVSVHAVHGVTEVLGRHRLQIPPDTRIAAVGPKTAAQCARASMRVDFTPRERIDSEGLLEEMHGLDVAGKNVLIFRGQSGREVIKQELEARGARVCYVESYRRKAAPQSVSPLFERWRKNEIHLAVIGSAAVLDAILGLLGPRNRGLLEEMTIVAYSWRVADYCRQAGLTGEIRVAEKPTDESAVEAIIEWATAV